MRLEGQQESENVEDRRSVSPRGMVLGGGIGTLVLMLIVWAMGGNPLQLLQQQPGQPGQVGNGPARGEDKLKRFVSIVLSDTEVVWTRLFEQQGRVYKQPKLVLFNGTIKSACGFANAAVGPFYCPADEKVYIDLSFYRELKERFGAPGDFAQAYVIAHEIGHHVQKQLGISDRIAALRRRAGERQSNQLSVRLELQADFLAGVWAHHADRAFHFIEPGDIEEALRCAHAIGDDQLQRQALGTVVPDSFTHGTSEQRMRWFMLGWNSGDISKGDTFNSDEL
jgi:uncharacterized protein